MKFLFILLLLFFDINVECNKSWNLLYNKSLIWSKDYSNQLRNRFKLITDLTNISIECNTSIWQTVNGIQNLEVWAIDLINSWGSFPPSGVTTGTTADFGSYDQCLDIEPNDIIGRPQYCLIDLKPPIPRPMPIHHNLHHRIDILTKDLPKNQNKSLQNVFESYSEFASFFYWISLRTGVCTSSKCSPKDISMLAKGFADSYGLEHFQTRCETKPIETKITWIQLIAISFTLSSVIIAAVVTLWERLIAKHQNSKKSPLLIELFSLRQNVKSLFAERSSEVFSCIHGIRVLTLVWVIFSHSTEWTNFQLFSRAFRVKSVFARIDSQLTLNGEYAVENFFFIGGMLTSFIILQFTGGKLSRFNVFEFIFSRYFRLTPQLIIYLLLTSLIPLIGSGPIWSETISPIIETCSKNWWWNIFYVQNLFKGPEICALHSWFLACDMQYHWISILLIIPLLYKLKLGLLLTFISIIFFYFTSFFINYFYDLPPGLINTGRDDHFMNYYIDLFYYKPWSHTSPFFIGFLLGVIVYNKKFTKLSQTLKYLIFGSILMGYVLCLMDTYHWNDGKPHNRLLSAFILSSSRVIWSASTATLTWMCISGNGGLINRFLSSYIFIPLSRLTYSVYLTHVWMIWYFVGTRRERIDTDMREIMYIFIHNLIISYIIGFLFALLFELPVLKLQKHLLNKYLKNVKQNNNSKALGVNLDEMPIEP